MVRLQFHEGDVIRHRYVGLAVAFTFGACGSSPESAKSSERSSAFPDTLSLDQTDSFRSGSEGGGRVLAIGVTKAGVVWYFDAVANQLFRVPAGSDSALAVSGNGRGPGEYIAILSMAAIADDRILARDIGSNSLHLFSDDGSHLRSVTVPGGELAGQIALRVLKGGRVAVGTERPPRATSELQPRAFYVFDSLGGEASPPVMAALKYSNDCPIVRLSSPGTPVLNSFPSAVWTLTPSGKVLAGCAARYELDLWEGDSVVRTIARDAARVMRTPEERRASVQRFTTAMSREFAGWTWQGPEIPELMPHFFRILVAEDGRYWIKTPRPSMPCGAGEDCAWRTRFGFDIWGADLSFEASVNIPESFRFTADPVIRGDTVWGVSEGADGIETVARFVLRRTRK
jgi:hypothetical protein